MRGASKRSLVADELAERLDDAAAGGVVALRRIRRDASHELRDASGEEVLAVVESLVRRGPEHVRTMAYELLSHHGPAEPLLRARALEGLGRGMSTWGEVDAFGVLLAGPAWRRGTITDATVHRWARATDRWWRRAALVATVPLNLRSRGGHGDPVRTLGVCEALVEDRDDMVVKAMSWALRELAKHEPGPVRAFVDRHGDDLAPRVRREVTNKLRTGLKDRRREAR